MLKKIILGSRHRVKMGPFVEKGEALAQIEGVPLYVSRVAPGEEARVCVTEVRPSFARARPEQILKPSPSRISPPCSYFEKCGGCQWQHLNYGYQLRVKREKVKEALKKIPGFDPSRVKEVLPSRDPYHYRNKSQRPFVMKRGEIVSGFFYPLTHRLIPIEECKVEQNLINQIFRKAMELIRFYRIVPYSEKSHEGFLRCVMARQGVSTGEAMVVLMTQHKEFPEGERFAKEMREAFSNLVSVVQNVNSEKGNVILGNENILLAGEPFIHEKIKNLKMRISVGSFFQVHSEQAVKICEAVERMAALTGLENVLDLYGGVGLMGLSLASGAQKIYEIENGASAVADGKVNAQANGIHNVEWICEDVSLALIRLRDEGKSFEVAILDPPRQGCGRDMIKILMDLSPRKIIYVSCLLKSLVEDVRFLKEGGYEIREVEPVDLFPQTAHVETVTLLEKC
ncbi:MAG: 23S rRNA (uracil(1939)-C(5))-methyltransferase RlmD [Chlamydiae bacterium]|nr:23S rRNA (uracil(1939)-C(5))-methyltransferase RlmD [Chlamydiota bacterium]MBI3267230.1 23S rRNA (uracil(1939)-C(5))-methyltransferase RlmD [Chlamydiota bacterium]